MDAILFRVPLKIPIHYEVGKGQVSGLYQLFPLNSAGIYFRGPLKIDILLRLLSPTPLKPGPARSESEFLEVPFISNN